MEFTDEQVRLMDEHAELAAVVKKKGYGVWAMPVGDNDFDAMTGEGGRVERGWRLLVSQLARVDSDRVG